jgi:EmrB/QacA subfamily drug resistance transporter
MRLHGPRLSDQPSAASDTTSRRGLLGVLLVAQLMVILDISAVNVALPDMADDLGIGGGDIGWVITSYSLIFGSLLLLGGRAADLLGRRRLFLAGLTVFTVASFASAVSQDATMLFAARAGQGLGAAVLSPAALSIITTAFQGKDRARALGAWGAVGGAGAAIGVLMGGVLTDVSDWRAIFYINVPVGLALAVVATKVVPSDPAGGKWRGLDLRGAAVATLSLAAILFAVSQAGSAGWASTQTLALGLAGLVGLGGFAAMERGTNQPLLRVQRLADRAVGGGFLLMLIASAALFGMFLLSSLYLQNVLGTSPLKTGLAFLPVAVTTGMGAHVGSQLVSRLGVRVPMAGGFAAVALGMLLLAGVDRDNSYATSLLPGMLLVGLGLGVVLVGVAFSVLTGARDEESGMLSGLNTTGHEVGGSFGVAVLVSIATAATGTGAANPIGASGIADAFLAAGILAGLGSLIALIVLPSARTFLPRLRLAPAPMGIH